MKICTKCKIEKDESEFYKHRGLKSGLSCACKNCTRVAGKQFREANPTYDKDRKLKFREDNPEQEMINNSRKRAMKHNLEFTIDVEDINIPTYCPVLGIELKRGVGKFCDTSPSLDRIDNSKGYIKNNVRVISFRANSLKNSGSIVEFEAIIKYMKGEL